MSTFDGVIETDLEYWLGTDKLYDFYVYTTSAKTAIRDSTGYTTSFIVKRRVQDDDADALIAESGVVSGTFNADPAINTQKITVTIDDDDTDTEVDPGDAHWELKRTNTGSEVVLAFGTITLRRALHVG